MGKFSRGRGKGTNLLTSSRLGIDGFFMSVASRAPLFPAAPGDAFIACVHVCSQGGQQRRRAVPWLGRAGRGGGWYDGEWQGPGGLAASLTPPVPA